MVKQAHMSLAKKNHTSMIDICLRERLFQIIDKGRNRPVIWISGPAGSGKTTLVSSYLEAYRLPNLWYRINESDAKIGNFFNYMSMKAEKIKKQKNIPLPIFTPECQKDISKFARQYFDNFYGKLPYPFILVFDNYQNVQSKSLFQEVIKIGLSELPLNINIIFISRSDIPPVLARMRTDYLPAVIGWNELKFTLKEMDEIVRKRLGKYSKDIIQSLYNKTDGWVAGIVLMLERARKEKIDLHLLNEFIPEEIFDYFSTEVFENADEEIRNFLLKTAFLPQITSKMAENLTGHHMADRILMHLNRNNYFLEKYLGPGEADPVYRYHPLFKEFLLLRAKDFLLPDDLLRTQQNASSILVEFNLIEEAARLFSETRNWDELIKLIYRYAGSMIVEGKNKTLIRWINSLSKDIVENTPWLLYWKGMCYMPFNPDESYGYFEQAFKIFNDQQDTSGILLASTAAVESTIYDRVFKRLDKWFSLLNEPITGFKGFPSKEIEARVASCMFKIMVLRHPEHPELDSWAERALSLSQDCEDITTRMQTLLYFAWHRLFTGDFAKAALMIDSLKEVIESGIVPPLYLLHLKSVEAFYYFLMAMPEQCEKTISDGIELAHMTEIHIMDDLLLGCGVANALSKGETGTSKKLLKKSALSIVNSRALNKSFYHLLLTWEALIKNDMTQALLHADLALKSAFNAGFPQNEAVCYLAKAQIMHETGEQKQAEDLLRLSSRIGKEINSHFIEFMCFLSESQFAFDHGEEETGLMLLNKAMDIGKRHGYVNIFIWRATIMTKLCIKAIESGIEVEYVKDIVKKRELIPDIPPVHIENWPWPLKIYTLGGFELIKGGKPLRFSRKVQKKPLALLKVLITLGGKEVSEVQIIDILWKDAEGDVAHKSFATTLHRLRKLIGNEKAIQLRESRVTLDPRYCYVDVWAFERIIGQIEKAWEKEIIETDIKTVQLAEKAVEMYKGLFLAEEIDQPWTVSFRERLRSKFLRNVRRLSYYWEEVGDFNKAINCYHKGLEVDDLAEEFYQRLMSCYVRLGMQTEALTIYNRCRSALYTGLGIEPSTKTKAIYKSLLPE